MEHFIINSSVCLFVFWLFYKLALENITWHKLKRFYLLASIFISMAIPFLFVKTVVVPLEDNLVQNFVGENLSLLDKTGNTYEFQWLQVLVAFYLLGVVVMLWRFIKNLRTFQIKNDDTVTTYSNYLLIIRKARIAPHSFFNRIFIHKTDHERNAIPSAVYEHEKAHLDQKHSLDSLLIEALIVLFWFNPVFYMLKYSIKLNHEFLADRCVLQNGTPTSAYQKLIVQYASTNYAQHMANTFHFPLLKKRFKIMKTSTSKTSGILRILAIIPLTVILIFSCGQEEIIQDIEQPVITEKQELFDPMKEEFKHSIIIPNNQTKGSIVVNNDEFTFKVGENGITFYDKEGNLFDYKKQGYEVLRIREVLEELSDETIEEYNRLAKKHKAYMKENETLIAWKEQTKRMQVIYNTMTEEQRAANEPWPYLGTNGEVSYGEGEIPPPPPPTTLSQTPPPPPPPPPIIEEME